MGKRLIVTALVCATLMSFVGCSNVASNDDTSKKPTNDTTVEPEIDQNAWKSGKFTLACVEIPKMKVEPHATLNYLATPNIHFLTDYSVKVQKCMIDK